jgi:(E)-4-hydroxy-3-methylbut-2-enyl-diphosphate synthase
MVESAMEFLRIARSEDYHNIVLSMKSSNPQVMVQAYRLLVQHMMEEFGEAYPLHLGVTEAGDGEDGRIKSAIGIGTLLEDGIGDTIRVSLTEDPELEIPVCNDIIKRYTGREQRESDTVIIKLPYSPYEYNRRSTFAVSNIGDKHVPVVIADFSKYLHISHANLQDIGYSYDEGLDKWKIGDAAADYIFCNGPLDFELPGTLKVLLFHKAWLDTANKEKYIPLFDATEYLDTGFERSPYINFVMIDYQWADYHLEPGKRLMEMLRSDPTAVICLSSTSKNAMQDVRSMFIDLVNLGIKNPAIVICDSAHETTGESLVHYSIETGGLLLDGFCDGICLGHHYGNSQVAPQAKLLNSIAFGILQATRTRISKTEYISCPSCGRTLFDLQETTAKIRAVTNHLKGVKIAIMGCIVNGPGEMADADFGYVGSGVGKITLYKGKEVVKRNIDSHIAVDELINLLKENEAWVEVE